MVCMDPYKMVVDKQILHEDACCFIVVVNHLEQRACNAMHKCVSYQMDVSRESTLMINGDRKGLNRQNTKIIRIVIVQKVL